jgi:hypothetical protein
MNEQQAANIWRPTACILCYMNCGLEFATEGRRITRVRGDRANARSQGYLCQKPQRLQWYGDHADRLTTPLRRRPDGAHEPISWETAFTEIAARLNTLRAEHGGEAFAFYGGGGQGNHLGGPYFLALQGVVGATKYFNALSQEKTGDFWVNGRLYGSQLCHTAEDIEAFKRERVIGKMESDVVQATASALKAAGLHNKHVGFDDLRLAQAVQSLPGFARLRVVDAYDIFIEIRKVRTSEELRLHRIAAKINQEAIEAVLEAAEPSLPYSELARIYRTVFARHGGRATSDKGLVAPEL